MHRVSAPFAQCALPALARTAAICILFTNPNRYVQETTAALQKKNPNNNTITEISIKLHAYQKAPARNVVMRSPLFCPFPLVIISPARLQRRQEVFSLCRMWTPIFSVTHTAGPRLFAPLRLSLPSLPSHPPSINYGRANSPRSLTFLHSSSNISPSQRHHDTSAIHAAAV